MLMLSLKSTIFAIMVYFSRPKAKTFNFIDLSYSAYRISNKKNQPNEPNTIGATHGGMKMT